MIANKFVGYFDDAMPLTQKALKTNYFSFYKIYKYRFFIDRRYLKNLHLAIRSRLSLLSKHNRSNTLNRKSSTILSIFFIALENNFDVPTIHDNAIKLLSLEKMY